MIFWRRNIKLAKENIGHFVGKVLACMDYSFLKSRIALQSPANDGSFDELRPGADYS